MTGRNSFRLAVILVAILSWSGCLFRSHKVPTRTTVTSIRSATLNELVGTINAQASAVQTLNATVDIDTAVGGAKKGKVTEYQEIRGYILIRKPSNLRMIGLFPVVRNRAFDMVSDAEGFKLYIPAKNRFIVGPPEVTTPSKNALENLRPNVIQDALLLQPVDPNNEIAVLEKDSETVTDSKTKNSVEFPTYVVDIIRKGTQGWFLSRKVIFSRIDLMPQHQHIYDRSGALVTEATYQQYQDYNGVRLPSRITIIRPQEEYTIGISLLKVTLNEPLKNEQFALEQPPGAQLVRLDANNSTVAETPGGDKK